MTTTNSETIVFTIETDGERSELVLPRSLVELLAADGDSPTDVVADIAQFDCTRRIYEAVHTSEGKVDTDLHAVEADALALFESHFGTRFEEVIGETASEEARDDHQH